MTRYMHHLSIHDKPIGIVETPAYLRSHPMSCTVRMTTSFNALQPCTQRHRLIFTRFTRRALSKFLALSSLYSNITIRSSVQSKSYAHQLVLYRAFTHDDRYDDRYAYRSSYQASKHCLRIWPRPLACLRRRICSLQMEEVNTF